MIWEFLNGVRKGSEMALVEGVLRKVWERGTIMRDADPDIWRKDECGAWMRWDFYEERGSQFGWEVDQIVSVTEGGGWDLSNLRPLQWWNKVSKRAGRLVCPMTASGRYNVRR